MKRPRTVVLSTITSLLALAACDADEPTTDDAIEAVAAELAEAHGLEDYTIEVIDPPADVPMPSPAAPAADDLASEQPDPEEMTCWRYYDYYAFGICTTCRIGVFGCNFYSTDCTGEGWSDC
ncbi:MAG: hypothetical protein K1X88_31715 [Nannocystaceae bacterium]|nr:hypothetical protein [Nannocystaceae bacterium]